ncbi:MAG: hypothetical protein C0602_10065 [Denitrovibrio sp.]|nr:MAG: hypothetical protein C0602_10065 [Denitrovibrio sp.]
MSQVVLKNERPAKVALYMLAFTGAGFAVINQGLGLAELNSAQLSVAIMLGVIPTAIAIGFLYLAMDLIGATYVSLFSSFEPAATLLLAAVLIGEEIVSFQIYGVVLLILGIVVPNLRIIMNKP